MSRNPTDYLYDEVFCDGSAAAMKAVEYLISLGHRHIAYIGDCNFESRYIGYYQALLVHKIPLNYQNIHPSRQTLQEGYDIMCSILRSGASFPSAIFCTVDTDVPLSLAIFFSDKTIPPYVLIWQTYENVCK